MLNDCRSIAVLKEIEFYMIFKEMTNFRKKYPQEVQ